MPTESRDYDAHAHACTNKLQRQQQPARLGLSGGHGGCRGEGAHCVWGPDLALPASDNRITANWTWAGEERRWWWFVGCIPPSHCISLSSAVAMCPATLSHIHNLLENHAGELQLADPDWRREEGREQDGCQSEWRDGSLHRVKAEKKLIRKLEE